MLDRVNPVTARKEALWGLFEAIKARGLHLNMTRGNPSPEQLKLSNPMLRIRCTHSPSGVDCRNYSPSSLLPGLPEARALCARYLGSRPANTIVVGNSSLQLMYATLALALRKGRAGWGGSCEPTFLCPSPGYDRHFKICEELGIKMIPIAMTPNGPDMDAVREHVKNRNVVGIFCVPKNSNPGGETYSAEVVEELVSMKCACPGFIIMWDNAYAMHDWVKKPKALANIFALSRARKTEDRVFGFGSFSKVTFAGAGLAMMATSEKNLEWFLKNYGVQTIGSDKLNQLRHVLFLNNLPGIRAHMRKHAKVVGPKFKVIDEVLEREIGGKGIAHWSKPDGGYFISFFLTKGSAKRVEQLLKYLGIEVTAAGSAFPYGHNPKDNHLRVPPTERTVAENRTFAEALAVCAEIAHWETWPKRG